MTIWILSVNLPMEVTSFSCVSDAGDVVRRPYQNDVAKSDQQ